jgi:hypothetical protein
LLNERDYVDTQQFAKRIRQAVRTSDADLSRRPDLACHLQQQEELVDPLEARGGK